MRGWSWVRTDEVGERVVEDLVVDVLGVGLVEGGGGQELVDVLGQVGVGQLGLGHEEAHDLVHDVAQPQEARERVSGLVEDRDRVDVLLRHFLRDIDRDEAID